MDETITTLHTVAASVERYAVQSTASNALTEARLDMMTKSNEALEERLSVLEATRPGGGKKAVAIAAGVGGTGGILGTLASSGALEFLAAVGKRIFP